MSDENEQDEKSLFHQAMQNVRPLKTQKRILSAKRRPSPKPRQRWLDEEQVKQDMMSDPADYLDIVTGDELYFARPGVQPKVMRRLQRGEYAIQAELDLHRMTKDAARQAVANFLHRCKHHHIRNVRIVHGKGHGSPGKIPVLKTHVNHWLQQRDEVLAFCSARPNDGGTGALYVLLKNYNRQTTG